MTIFIALLRAVNVGGTGKLPMTELKTICESSGFTKVRTYIASGNVIFESKMSEKKVKELLEKKLQAYAGKPIGVLIRTNAEMEAVVRNNPFSKFPSNKAMAIFLDERPPVRTIADATGTKNEEMKIGTREIYVYYPNGQGDSRLKIPAAATGTARNMNTIAKLVEIAASL